MKEPLWWYLHGVPADDGSVFLDVRCAMLTDDGRCRIYEDRPSSCRQWPIGGPECREAIQYRRGNRVEEILGGTVNA